MSDSAKALLKPVVKLLRHVEYESTAVLRMPQRPRNIHEIVWDRAAETSADYVDAHLGSALVFETREKLWDHALSKVTLDGLVAEFGVWSGESINHFARELAPRGQVLYGFDSFEGLKEDWKGTGHGRGAFDLGGNLPPVEPNVRLVKGWFDQTVPEWAAANPGPLAFVHFDADTYESTALLLRLLGERIRPGTIIVFDEYLGYPGWIHGEHKAWREYVAASGLRYEYLGFAAWGQAGLRVL